MGIVLKILGVLIILGGLFYVLVFSPFRLIGLHKISGADVGPYKDHQIVFSKALIYENGQIKKGEVVIFSSPIYNDIGEYSDYSDSIGQIAGIPGDPIFATVLSYDKNPSHDMVADGYYLVQTNTSALRVIPADKIKYVVWGGL